MAEETILERRERARRLATSIVSFAIMAMGVALLAAAVLLAVRGRLPLILAAFLVGGLGVAIVLGGLFFHLVPSKLDRLADEKRDYDRREAAKRAGEPGPRNGATGAPAYDSADDDVARP